MSPSWMSDDGVGAGATSVDLRTGARALERAAKLARVLDQLGEVAGVAVVSFARANLRRMQPRLEVRPAASCLLACELQVGADLVAQGLQDLQAVQDGVGQLGFDPRGRLLLAGGR